MDGQGAHVADDAVGQTFGAGLAEVVALLEIEPEFGGDAEIDAEAQGRVRGDGPPAVDDVADALRRHAKVAPQAVLADAQRLHEFFEEDFSWMNEGELLAIFHMSWSMKVSTLQKSILACSAYTLKGILIIYTRVPGLRV